MTALDAAGLECVAVYGQHFDAQFVKGYNEDEHTKAMFVTRLRRDVTEEVRDVGN
jgi:hypothetical protein